MPWLFGVTCSDQGTGSSNPLNATDPTGFFLGKWKQAIVHPNQFLLSKMSYGTAQMVVSIASNFCGPASYLCAAAGTYDNMKAHGATTSQALRGGVVAGIVAFGNSYGPLGSAGMTGTISYIKTGSLRESFRASAKAFVTSMVTEILSESLSVDQSSSTTGSSSAASTGGRMVGGAVNGYMQTGTLNGAVRGGIAAGLVPDDLGMTQAYNDNPMANISIGIVRDGIRGYIVGGREGIVDGIKIGQTNNLAGHIVGMVTTQSLPTFRNLNGTGVFVYEENLEIIYGVGSKNWAGQKMAAAITLGNVISGPSGLGTNPDYADLRFHELSHVNHPGEKALGAMYIPIHGIDMGLYAGSGGRWNGLEQRMQYCPYSQLGTVGCSR